MEEADRHKNKFSHNDGDHLTLLNVFNAWKTNNGCADWCWNNYINSRALKQANDIREQLMKILIKQGLVIRSTPHTDPLFWTNIKKCIVSGFFMQVCLLQRAGHYLTLKDDQTVMLHPSTVIDNKPEWVLYHEFVLTSRNYVRTCLEIYPDWLFEVSPEYFDLQEGFRGESKRKLERVLERIK